jgi:tetratricopeptide (TPR) repeat protein
MQKQRIIIVVLSLILIIVLFNLPRIVVENDDNQDMQDGNKSFKDPFVDKDLVEQHSLIISIEVQERLKRYLEQYNGADDKGRLKYADSIAILYLSISKFDSAAKYLDHIAVAKPGLEAYQRAGDSYYEAFGFAMDKEKAIELGDRARHFYNLILSEEPDRLDLQNKIAMTYISTTNPMQGITMLRDIMEKDPENEMAIFNLGLLAIQSGQYERAIERFEKLVSLHPQNLQGQFYLGLSYFESGDKNNARTQFELVKSMESDPAVIATADGYLKEID